MADTPKSPTRTPKPAGALSAADALKAAETALDTNAAKKAPARKAPVKAAAKPAPAAPVARVAKPAPAKIAPEPAPVAVIAATTAVDAAPEPAPLPPAAAETAIEAPVAPKTETSETNPLVEGPVATPVAEGLTTMNDVLETGKKFAEDAKAKMETAYADFNDKAKAHVEKSTKAIEEISDLTKGNVEALVESGKIAAKAIETMGQDAAEYSRKNLEKATATIKSLASAKTPTEFFQLQSALISSSFDEFTKEAAKNGEAFIKIVGDVAQPINARVGIVTDKIKTLAA